jgi:hypothetical protein
MPIEILSAIIVYCSTFTVLVIALEIVRARQVAETAALLAFIPAIIAYVVMA